MPTKARPRYIVDSRGRRREVVLPVKQFEAMVREIEDLRDAQYVDEAEATAEGFVGLEELTVTVPGARGAKDAEQPYT